jgi:hypothetical protein
VEETTTSPRKIDLELIVPDKMEPTASIEGVWKDFYKPWRPGRQRPTAAAARPKRLMMEEKCVGMS